MFVMGVLNTMKPQEEIAQSEPGDDREGTNNIQVNIVEEKKKDKGDKQENDQVEEAPC